MNPITGGALIGAGADLLSGFMGRDAQRDANSANIAAQEQFAKMGIRWRVEDAKAAGVHPLFALGANVPTFSPSFQALDYSDLSRAGQDISRAVSATLTPEERAEHNLRLNLLRAQIEETDARTLALNSQVARDAQSQIPGIPNAAGVTTYPLPDKVIAKGDAQISAQGRAPSVTAGTHPAFREYVVTDWGLKMDLPYSEEGPSEAMENIPFWMWPMIIQHNRNKYGPQWGQRFWKEYVQGESPKFRQESKEPGFLDYDSESARRFRRWMGK